MVVCTNSLSSKYVTKASGSLLVYLYGAEFIVMPLLCNVIETQSQGIELPRPQIFECKAEP